MRSGSVCVPLDAASPSTPDDTLRQEGRYIDAIQKRIHKNGEGHAFVRATPEMPRGVFVPFLLRALARTVVVHVRWHRNAGAQRLGSRRNVARRHACSGSAAGRLAGMLGYFHETPAESQ